jgi:hypothetical protein
VTDRTKELTEPSDEKRIFYCRRVFKTDDTMSTALMLFSNSKTNKSETSTPFETKPKNRVEEMIEKFEDKEINFKDKLASRFRMKEKGIVIKVKKNQIEDVLQPNEENNSNEVKIDQNSGKIKEVNSQSENEIATLILDYNQLTNSKTEETKAINYSDYMIENENDFLEPLI